MRIKEYDVPDDLVYTKEHEWAKVIDDLHVLVGITDYAVKSLHDVVYVDLPQVGSKVTLMSVFGTVESIKAVSDLYSPLSGKVIRVNEELVTRPELVNESTYEDGWLIEVAPSNLSEDKSEMLNPEKYVEYISELMSKKS